MSIWVIIIAVMVLSFIIQRTLQSKFDKYSDVPAPGGLTGAEVARLMLERNGIHDVEVISIDGRLTDHYNPTDSTINLSRDVYGGRSVAACAVAAHETGHAIQHAKGYGPLRLRTAMVPVVTFANNTVQWVLLLGVLLVQVTPALLWAGIALPFQHHHASRGNRRELKGGSLALQRGRAGCTDQAYGRGRSQVGCLYLRNCGRRLSRHASLLYRDGK